MKKTMRIFAVIAMTISASFVNANETAFKADVIGVNKLKVEVLDIKGSFTYEVKSLNGEVLYSENSDNGLLKMVFDLSQLDDGDYEINVKDEIKTRSLPITITSGKLVIVEKAMTKIFSPTIVQSDDLVTVKLLSNEQNDLSINVQTVNGRSLVEDKIDGQNGLIGKKYHLIPGQYIVTVSSDEYSKVSYIDVY